MLLWIVSYIGISLCSLMPSAAMSLVNSEVIAVSGFQAPLSSDLKALYKLVIIMIIIINILIKGICH